MSLLKWDVAHYPVCFVSAFLPTLVELLLPSNFLGFVGHGLVKGCFFFECIGQVVPTAPALIATSGTMALDMEVTIAGTTTTTIMVALNTTGNIDVVGTSGLTLNGATAGKIGRRGQNTDDGLLPPNVIDAVALASDCAFPFLLIQTITEDRLLT